MTKEQLHQELAKTPLGRALVAGLKREELVPEPITSYYTRPQTQQVNTAITLKEFWQGKTITPPIVEEPRETNISAILVKKAGDFSEFWHRDTSFIATMGELYQRVKNKNRDLL